MANRFKLTKHDVEQEYHIPLYVTNKNISTKFDIYVFISEHELFDQ